MTPAATATPTTIATSTATATATAPGISTPAPAATPTRTPTATLTPAGGRLTGAYDDNRDFTALTLTRVDATVNFTWGNGVPGPSMASATFSVRWTGQVLADYAETDTCSTTSSDGVKLWVDGQLIIDNWTNCAGRRLTAGVAPDRRAAFLMPRRAIRITWRETTMPAASAQQLRAMTEAIFTAAGATAAIAATVADALVLANLLGHDSHGVMRIPSYVQQIKRGRLQPAAEPVVAQQRGATALVDGRSGFGQVAGRFATDQVVALAKEYGAAAAGVINCMHVGRLGEYPERAARQGVLLLVTAGSIGSPGARVAPFGGRAGVLGTNPFAIGLPAGERPPMIVDFATTVIAGGKVEVARAKGVAVPPGALLDKHGRPTTNPNDLADGGLMLTVGGHKGFGLALAAAVLSQGVTGELRLDGQPSPMGFFLWAVDSGAFTPAAEYGRRVDWMIEQVKAVPPAEGFSEVLVPGEPEQRERARREAEGIPVPEATWAEIIRVAEDLGVRAAIPAVG
jgi:LDH2 family malate/lactate/ureidoglycolate dehydrogenase